LFQNPVGFEPSSIDMDGVIYHGNSLLKGALEFVDWLSANGKGYLFPHMGPKFVYLKASRSGFVSVLSDIWLI
jgi:NagD protein